MFERPGNFGVFESGELTVFDRCAKVIPSARLFIPLDAEDVDLLFDNDPPRGRTCTPDKVDSMSSSYMSGCLPDLEFALRAEYALFVLAWEGLLCLVKVGDPGPPR